MKALIPIVVKLLAFEKFIPVNFLQFLKASYPIVFKLLGRIKSPSNPHLLKAKKQIFFKLLGRIKLPLNPVQLSKALSSIVSKLVAPLRSKLPYELPVNPVQL